MDVDSTLAKVLKTASPLIANVLGTPLASMAVSLLANAFNVGTGKASDVANAILADPDYLLKLKQIEADHSEAFAKISSQNYAMEVSDRVNARANAELYKDFLRHMAYVVTVGFFAALGLLFVPVDIGANARELLSMLVGMLASKWQTIIDFFYGSTHALSSHHVKMSEGK